MRVRLMAVILGAFVLAAANVAVAQPRNGQSAGAADAATAGNTGAAGATTTADQGADAAAAAAAAGDAGEAVQAGADGGAVEPGAAATGDAATAMTGEQYVVRLRDLEQRINELKEEIFRSKARLSLLAESVLQNVVGGARAIIQHDNEMGNAFRLVSAVYALDGAPILQRHDENGSLADLHDFPVYNGQIGAGDHTLTVNLEYQGNGYGIFSYVKGYTFRVRSTQSFSVPDGKAIQIRVVGYEKGGPMTPPEERPAVRYIQRVMSLRDATDESDRQNNAPESAGGGAASAPQGGAGSRP